METIVSISGQSPSIATLPFFFPITTKLREQVSSRGNSAATLQPLAPSDKVT